MKREPPKGTVVGYAGLIFPEHSLWNEYFLYAEYETQARALLEKVRGMMPYGPDGAKPMEGVNPENLHLIGPLASTWAEVASMGLPDAGLYGHALALAMNTKYPVVKAVRNPGGTATDVWSIPQAQIMTMQMFSGKKEHEVASSIIQKDKDVMAMKARMDAALKAATPDQIARIGRYMKEQPAEVNRNPMIVLKILDEVDPGISG
jgi:hypothetical protein